MQAIYSIAVLAKIANITHDLMLRVLRSNRVVFVCSERSLYVPLSEIEQRIPPLWQGILAAEKVRRMSRAEAEAEE